MVNGYSIMYSLIHDRIVKDEAGHTEEWEFDETLYQYLVLF